MNKIILMISITFLVFTISFFLLLKLLVIKNKKIKELEHKLKLQKEIENEFKKIDEKSEEDKEKLRNGTDSDKFAASIDILQKHQKRSSGNTTN